MPVGQPLMHIVQFQGADPGVVNMPQDQAFGQGPGPPGAIWGVLRENTPIRQHQNPLGKPQTRVQVNHQGG